MQVVKNLPANAGDARDTGLIPGSGRSPGGGNGNPLQYSCLENPMDWGAWWTTVHGIAEFGMTVNTHTQCLVITNMSKEKRASVVQGLPFNRCIEFLSVFTLSPLGNWSFSFQKDKGLPVFFIPYAGNYECVQALTSKWQLWSLSCRCYHFILHRLEEKVAQKMPVEEDRWWTGILVHGIEFY